MSLSEAPLQQAQPTTLRMWLGVLTVSVGIFAMITAEQLPVGLIPVIADQLGVTVGLRA